MHAQIEVYASRPMTEEERRGGPLMQQAYFDEVQWGWRKVVRVSPDPERWADTGLVFDDRDAALVDAAEKNPGWGVG